MPRRPQQNSDHGDDAFRPVRIGRRVYPVIGRMQIRNRTYLLLERLSPAPRERYMAFDPHAGPDGELRAVHVYQRTAAMQHVRVLKRLPRGRSLPFIVDYDTDHDELRLALEWVVGLDLKDYLERVQNGRLARPSPYEAVRLVRGMAHGLRTLNQYARIIHGDVKPANLIVTRKPSQLVMIDYGSAWLAERTAMRMAGDGVSVLYAAPELQNGDTGVNDRADQFSASVILYELLTLSLPYANLGGKAGRPEYRNDKNISLLEPPSTLLPDPGVLPIQIRNELDTVVARGLMLKADDRYPTSREWLDALDGLFLRMQEPSPPPPSSTTTIMNRAFRWLDCRLGNR